jgi:6-phosphogluconolactonase (cycloisomerase 2 family)
MIFKKMDGYTLSALGACMKRFIGYTAALCLLAITVGCGGVSNSGTLAYISNSSGTGFTVFKVNTDGTLTLSSISPQSTPAKPKMLQFSANGKWAYFLDAAGANIYAYTRSGNGTLATFIDHYPVNGGSSLVIAPSSTFLYVSLPNSQNGQLAVFSIDQSTGILSQVGSSSNLGYSISQLVMAPGGASLYGLAPTQQQVVLFSLSTSSGVATFQGTMPVGSSPPSDGMILSANGSYMYVLDTQDVGSNNVGVLSPSIYAFNVTGTTLVRMAGQPFHENADALTGIAPSQPVAGATSNDSRFLFIANQGSHNISVFRIIPSSGTTGTAGEPTEILGSTTNTVPPVSTASPFDCGSGCTTPSLISVSNVNNALYVLDTPAGKIFQFAINQNTGQIRALNPAFVSAESASSNPSWITIR